MIPPTQAQTEWRTVTSKRFVCGRCGRAMLEQAEVGYECPKHGYCNMRFLAEDEAVEDQGPRQKELFG